MIKIVWIFIVVLIATGVIFGIYFWSADNASAPINKPDNTRAEETMTVKVFFGNSVLDPDFIDCSKNFSIERNIPKTKAVGRAALEQLLAGPTEAEKNEGYFTSINPGVEIKNLTIENNVAYIDFNEQLEFRVGGSCKVTAIRAQIENTLKQFPTVGDVVISVDGRTEDILQP